MAYCEHDDHSDQFANESADSNVGSEYQLSDLDEQHDFVGFEEHGGLFSAEEDEGSDEEGERWRGRGQRKARLCLPSQVRGGHRRVHRRGEGVTL